ncbi:hypothetical protein CISIN_1g0092822mg, partial [Citrus sinensis]
MIHSMASAFTHQLTSVALLLLLLYFPPISESNNLFCDAGSEYGGPQCGIQSSSKILIKGGTVVNAHHQQIADVYVEDGIVVAVQPNINVGDDVKVLDATGKFVMP